jgi:mitogen-activated protein kinase kinase kinase 5
MDCCRFQKACVAYGVPDVDLFQTVDLWDRKNIAQVTMTIFAIGRTVSSIGINF